MYRFLLTLPFFASPSLAAELPNQATPEIGVFISQSTPIAIAFMLSVTAIKITAFVLGYLIVKMGHDTLIKGITGEIDFGFKGTGIETKLKAGSPGAFFILAGSAIIIWGLLVEKPMDLSLTPNTQFEPEMETAFERGDEIIDSSNLRPVPR